MKKKQISEKISYSFWIGVVAFIVYGILDAMGLADSGSTEAVASFCAGIASKILNINLAEIIIGDYNKAWEYHWWLGAVFEQGAFTRLCVNAPLLCKNLSQYWQMCPKML